MQESQRSQILLSSDLDRRTTQDLSGTQVWRQIGWIGKSTGQVFSHRDNPFTDPVGFQSLWVLDENKRFSAQDDK